MDTRVGVNCGRAWDRCADLSFRCVQNRRHLNDSRSVQEGSFLVLTGQCRAQRGVWTVGCTGNQKSAARGSQCTTDEAVLHNARWNDAPVSRKLCNVVSARANDNAVCVEARSCPAKVR